MEGVECFHCGYYKERINTKKIKIVCQSCADVSVVYEEDFNNDRTFECSCGLGRFMKVCDALREVRVTFEDGHVIETSMSAHLTDEQIKEYYKIGRVFNVGSVGDNLQKVYEVEILL